MAIEDLDLIRKYDLKDTYIARKMGIRPGNLRYHLLTQLRNQETVIRFRQTIRRIARELMDDINKLDSESALPVKVKIKRNVEKKTAAERLKKKAR